MDAIILSIGDELVLGQTVDTNAAWLSARLAERGVFTRRHVTVPDDRPAIAEAIRHAATDAELVVSTGGLGPTDDDLTRFALADVMGADVQLDEQALADIAAFFQRRGRQMVDRNRVQAMCPVGARMLDNPVGTAPGIHARIRDAELFFVPGVPREMMELWRRHIEPTLPADAQRYIVSARINTFGKGESDIAEILGDLLSRNRNPMLGTTVAAGIVSVRVRSEFPQLDQARRELDSACAAVERCLGSLVFGQENATLADTVGAMLRSEGLTLTTAESCTGGLIGTMLTDAPGASLYYHGGWVTYANDAKVEQLGVDAALLENHGAVSEQVARAMADGALARSDADLAISVTGIAGPDGGTDEKPVGTVWFGLAQTDRPTLAQRHVFPGDRSIIRERAAHHALNLVRLRLLGEL